MSFHASVSQISACAKPSQATRAVAQQKAAHRIQNCEADLQVFDRRSVLGALTAGLALQAAPAFARLEVVTCDPTAEGDACRRETIRKDSVSGKSVNYEAATKQELKPVNGVPVSVLDDEYIRFTTSLGDLIEKYTVLDPYDPERQMAIKTIKLDGPKWVSKYARGGSARKQSARKFYIVVDAILGHIAANGLAPFPGFKAKQVTANIQATKDLLASGL